MVHGIDHAPRGMNAAVLPAVALALALSPSTALLGADPPRIAAEAHVGAAPRGGTLGRAAASPAPPPDRPGTDTRYVAPATGAVAHAFDPPTQRWEAGHRGVDLWSELGGVVVTPGAGVVTFAGSIAGKPVVVVTHPDGLRSSLEPVVATVSRGTTVHAGEPVGVLAAAPGTPASPDHCEDLGRSSPTATCVHWGVRRGEVYVDPLALLGQGPPIVLLPPVAG